MAKIDEFLDHEQDPNYFDNLLDKQLVGVSEAKKAELLQKRKAYSNNKNVYSRIFGLDLLSYGGSSLCILLLLVWH